MSSNVRKQFPAGRQNMQCIFYGVIPFLVAFQTRVEVTDFSWAGWSLFREGRVFVTLWNSVVVPELIFTVIFIPLPPDTCGNLLVPEGSISVLRKGTAKKKNQVIFKVLGITLLTLVERPGPKGGRTWCTSGYSDEELDHSLYKLYKSRPAQLEILQEAEQLGQILLQLRDRSRSPMPGGVWDSQDHSASQGISKTCTSLGTRRAL